MIKKSFVLVLLISVLFASCTLLGNDSEPDSLTYTGPKIENRLGWNRTRDGLIEQIIPATDYSYLNIPGGSDNSSYAKIIIKFVNATDFNSQVFRIVGDGIYSLPDVSQPSWDPTDATLDETISGGTAEITFYANDNNTLAFKIIDDTGSWDYPIYLESEGSTMNGTWDNIKFDKLILGDKTTITIDVSNHTSWPSP